MGNDGGSIPTRRELVKEAARNPTTTEQKETRHEQRNHRWNVCPLSHKPLVEPIVSDWLGQLYNKDAILEFLLPSEDETVLRNKVDSKAVLQDRVTSLKDVVEIHFELGASPESKNGRVCPITNKPLSASTRAAYLVPCGHAFLESAIKEVAAASCPQCNESFSYNNLITILPVLDSDMEKMGTRIVSLKADGLSHSLKKLSSSSKKRKKDATVRGVEEAHTRPTKGGAALDKIRNPATASLTAKVLEDEKTGSKRRKIDMNENLKGLFSAKGDGKSLNKTGDFMTRGFTIPK